MYETRTAYMPESTIDVTRVTTALFALNFFFPLHVRDAHFLSYLSILDQWLIIWSLIRIDIRLLNRRTSAQDCNVVSSRHYFYTQKHKPCNSSRLTSFIFLYVIGMLREPQPVYCQQFVWATSWPLLPRALRCISP
jgi:hypothetical protein